MAYSILLMKILSIIILLLVFYATPTKSAESNTLFSAAIMGKTERIKALLADGMDVNSQTATGRTAMMAASFNGNLRVAKILLSYGADVNLVDNSGSTALMDAVVFGSEKLVKLLITAGANVSTQNKQNQSAIDKAKKTKYKNIVKILEEQAKSDEENAEDNENTDK